MSDNSRSKSKDKKPLKNLDKTKLNKKKSDSEVTEDYTKNECKNLIEEDIENERENKENKIEDQLEIGDESENTKNIEVEEEIEVI